MKNADMGAETVAFGVTGSIAAYKAADLVSRMTQAGLDVHVLMTASAMKLVQPRTFLTLSHNPVITDLWEASDWRPGHIALAARAAVLVVAPATANILAKMARGIADDALSTYALSHTGAVIVAPAMNPGMWQHPAVQENCRVLKEHGVVFVGPDAGRVACGDDGIGRLADTDRIFDAVRVQLAAARLDARTTGPRPRILVTAGPTREPLDPVRFLSNRASGRMGHAVAAVAAAAACTTTLISGPVCLPPPPNCRCVTVETAADMRAAVKREFPGHDVLVMAAAVADYKAPRPAARKRKKAAADWKLELVRTEDILATIAPTKKPGQLIMGFAAETEDLETNARAKLERKNLDWIVANDVSRTDIGFAAEDNEVVVLSRDSRVAFQRMPKAELAAHLLEIVLTAAPG